MSKYYCPIIGTLGYVLSQNREKVLLVHRNKREQDDHFGKGGEEIEVVVVQGTSLYAVIDGYGSYNAQEGAFSLVVSKVADVELDCEDGQDNDGDGDIDCEDFDCEAVVACAPQGDLCGDHQRYDYENAYSQSIVEDSEREHKCLP